MKRAITLVGAMSVECVHPPFIEVALSDASWVTNIKVLVQAEEATRLLSALERWYDSPVLNSEVPDAYEMIDLDGPKITVGPASGIYQDDLIIVADCDNLAGDSDHKTVWHVPYALARHLPACLKQALAHAAAVWSSDRLPVLTP